MNIPRLSGSVGAGNAQNNANDVKLIRALLNVYLRTQKQAVLPITTTNDAVLEQAIHDFQVKTLKSTNPDSRVDVRGNTFSTLRNTLKNTFRPTSFKAPTFGIVTWESEGTEGGFYHSRKLHVPSRFSGLTIGRGYDCSQKTQHQISGDLIVAGVTHSKVLILKKAAGLKGKRAEQFIIDNDLLDYQITHAMQHALFKISYEYEAQVVRQISKSMFNISNYGKVDWSKTNKFLKDIIIDLKYRGDYTTKSRKFIQKPLANNDVASFKKIIRDKAKWPNVPQDRFTRRSNFISKAVISNPNKKNTTKTP
ncbi:MAG: hypothetical protein ACRBBR_15420 [Cellvibrionaceae bacterium]